MRPRFPSVTQFTSIQLGAFLGILVLALLFVASAFYHLWFPVGLTGDDVVVLGIFVSAACLLVPLYSRRFSWAYLVGIIYGLALFAGLGNGLLDRSVFFSFTAYNLLLLFGYLITIMVMVLSIQAFREQPKGSATAMVTGMVVFLLSWPVSRYYFQRIRGPSSDSMPSLSKIGFRRA